MTFLRDLRIGFYSLMRTQGFAIVVVLTLALGIGANAAIFTLVRGVLLNESDGKSDDLVVIVSETLAQRMFPGQDALNRHVYWTDPILQFGPGTDKEKARFMAPRRIIGVTADVQEIEGGQR